MNPCIPPSSRQCKHVSITVHLPRLTNAQALTYKNISPGPQTTVADSRATTAAPKIGNLEAPENIGISGSEAKMRQ